MSDLIDRQAAIAYAISGRVRTLPTSEDGEDWIRKEDVRQSLLTMPSAEPERKKGRWIDMGDFEQCSVCTGTHLKEVNTVYGKAIWIKSAYCPNCGANMRGE